MSRILRVSVWRNDARHDSTLSKLQEPFERVLAGVGRVDDGPNAVEDASSGILLNNDPPTVGGFGQLLLNRSGQGGKKTIGRVPPFEFCLGLKNSIARKRILEDFRAVFLNRCSATHKCAMD